MKNKKSLLESHPEIAKQWHPTKNSDLTPDQVVAGSGKKIWWKCSKGLDHEWQSVVVSRTGVGRKGGCPFCRNLKVSVTNSLEKLFPKLANEWHPTKNGDLKPDKIVSGSDKKFWWKCAKGPDHEWRANLYSRTVDNRGCPCCACKKVSVTNSLASLFPKIAKEWHPTKNGVVKPLQVIKGSKRRYWWKCPKGPDHEWQATVSDRTQKGSGCPCCIGQKVSVTNSLATLFPKIAKEWHSKNNKGLKPNQVIAGGHRKFWWKCSKGSDHEWQASNNSRTSRGTTDCPFCAGQKVSVTNSLGSAYPKIAKEWHPTKNGDIDLYKINSGTEKDYWWKCPKGPDHEWRASPKFRCKRDTGCPCCCNLRISVTNSLATLFPDIAAEWHPTKNGILKPKDVVYGADKKVWWKCSKGPDHEWKSNIKDRTGPRESGCPFCNIVPRSKQEIYLAFEILKFITFDIDKHKIKINNKIYDVDIIINKFNLIIEFDGSYWHKERFNKDYDKTQNLNNAGWRVIRVREKPLKKIQKIDVLVDINNIKQAANKLMTKINKIHGLQLPNLNSYLKRKTLLNKKAADAYIDKLLEDKNKNNS